MKKILTLATQILLSLSFLTSCTEWNTIQFYVSPDGSDENPGTKAAPFKSLVKAKSSVREKLSETPNKSIIVNIKGGLYPLTERLIFTEEDSGTEKHPVVYRAAKGETPTYTGSSELKSWEVLDDPVRLAMLPEPLRGKVYVCDLKSEGISNFGDPTEIGNRPDLFCNGQLQTLARWPNTGFVNAGQVKGKTPLPRTYINKRGTVEGVFEYTDAHQNRWAAESDVRLGGYWYWDWSDEFQKVERVDTLAKLLHLSKPFHGYGYRDSLRYFGLNLFQEIDIPGEWYLDRTEGKVYWLPPAEVSPGSATVTLSVYNKPFMVEIKNCSNITLEGLSFQEGRGSALLVSGGSNCRIVDCRVERFGKDGIHVMNGSNHRVSGCMLRGFGHGGIKLKGGDRKTLTAANHVIENTVVEHFSLFKRTYEPAVYIDGCGMTIRNNRFSHSSSSAMRLEGNDVTIEYNQISHVVNESDDQGALDMFYNPGYRGNVVRYNHWFDIRGGTLHGAAGVRLDDMISGVTVYGNVFERCGALHFGGVQIHGGKDNVVSNNLFFDCPAAFSFSPWGEKRWLEQLDSPVMTKKLYEDVDIRSELYQSRYPELKTIREKPDVNTIKDNLIVDCETDFLRNSEKQIKENNTSISSEGKALGYFCSDDVLKNYGLQPIPFKNIGPQKNVWLE